MTQHRKLRSRSARFEFLETRDMMAAGIAATLRSGVLAISGTQGSDAIAVNQWGNRISVTGVRGTFAARAVRQVTVDLRGGNDAVNIGVLQSPVSHARIGATVRSGAGNSSVCGPARQTAFFSGIGHTITCDARGVLLDGARPEWVDRSLRDAALRELTRDRLDDGVLDRADMLDVLRQAGSGGAVNSVEFAGLSAIVSNAALFQGVEYVGVLASKVVCGDYANAHYQGAALGNLRAGSSETHLDKLVDKWFFGGDHPLAASPWNSQPLTYRTAAGTLFSDTPRFSDVYQGAVGDCYFLAGLAETALRDAAAVSGMFIVNGDGTYTVRFYHDGRADYVTVDSMLPTDDSGRFVFANFGRDASDSSNVLWVGLAEKAYVQLNESGWSRFWGLPGSGRNEYDAISYGYIGVAFAQITGRNAWVGSWLGDFETFAATFQSGALVGLASRYSPSDSAVVGNHAYAVLACDADARQVTFFNPWGVDNGWAPDIVTMSWAQVQTNFAYWDFAA